MALRKGDAMIEFFSNLPLMREMYEKKGIVVAKRMYETLISEGKISMGYKNFAVLFSRNLSPKKEMKTFVISTPEKEYEMSRALNENHTLPQITEDDKEPIILRDRQKKASFNPYTVEIDPKKIW